MKKHISLILAFIMFTQPLFVLAGSPVIDPATTAASTTGATTGALTTSQQILKTLKDYGLDTVAYMLAQKLGQKMASLAINKANGGASADKDPNYVKDFGEIFMKVEQQTRDIYTTKLLTNTTNPYAQAIAKEMLQGSQADQLSKFTLGNFMTTYGTDGASLETVKSDLSSVGGNGLAFFGELANPQNTPVGSSLIAQNQLAQQIEAKKQTETLKLTSPGFTPDTKCKKTVADYKTTAFKTAQNAQTINGASANIDKEKSGLQTARDAQTQAIATYGDNSKEANAADEAYYAAEKAGNDSIAEQQGVIAGAATGIGSTLSGSGQTLAADTAGCIDEIIKNPLSAVQTITTDGGKFGMDMTKNIQGWGQIVAGLFVSLFNGFINTGLSSLKADYGQQKTKQTNTGGPEQLQQKALGGGIVGNTNFAKAPAIIVDLRNDLETSLHAVEGNIATLKNTSTQLFLVPARLATLDICIPGPDSIGLNTRLDKYYELQTAWMQKSSATGSDTKNNVDQQLVLSMLEQDYSIARTEMFQDMADDSRNIPGTSAMRTMVNTFAKKKALLQSNIDALAKALDALSQLREVNTQLKNSVSFLKNLEPAALGTLPGTVFTSTEWGATPQADRDAIYNWMKTHSPNKPVELTGQSAADMDASHMKYVIKNSWDLWEYPFQFFPATPVLDIDGNPTVDSGGDPVTDKKWSDEQDDGTSKHADDFLEKKNAARGMFNNIRDIIPTPYEVSKNEQVLTALKLDLQKTDDLIHDCDKMRELIWGTGAVENGIFSTQFGGDKSAFKANLIANKNTYFRSDEVRNALTLPNILDRNVSAEDDGCRPYNESDYPADISPIKNFSEKITVNGQTYVCMGNFGHTYNIENEGTIIDFNKWVDEGNNAYQVVPHINWPSDLYWRSRILRFIPPPVPDPYGKGWSYQIIDDGDYVGDTYTVNGVDVHTGDGGKGRGIFCRFNVFQGKYGERSGGLPHPNRNFYCSSKWADISVSQALGLFLINSLN